MVYTGAVAAILVIVLLVIVLAILSSAIVIIKPNEQGLYSRMGRFIGVLPPGINFITPLLGEVKRVDISTQSLTIQLNDVLSKQGKRFVAKLDVRYKIVDARKAMLETQSYADIMKQTAETSIRLAAKNLDEDDFWTNSNQIGETIRTEIEKTAASYGIAVSMVGLSPG